MTTSIKLFWLSGILNQNLWVGLQNNMLVNTTSISDLYWADGDSVTQESWMNAPYEINEASLCIMMVSNAGRMEDAGCLNWIRGLCQIDCNNIKGYNAYMILFRPTKQRQTKIFKVGMY